jgi:4-amino-4-deoxy-L-arabinose transferase-like glycosyltransferase
MSALNRQAVWSVAGVAALCAVFVAQLLLSVRQQSETFDEPCHMFSGYRALRYHDYGINPEHPPLLKMVAAMPLRNIKNEPPDQKMFFRGACALGGRGLLANNDTTTVLFRARSAAAIFSVVLVIVLLLAVREMFGKGPAFLALVLAVFEPTLLANGALVTTDMAITCFLFATVYAFWRYTQRPSVARLLVCALAAGLTLASKHSGLFALPLVAALAALDWAMPEKREDAQPVERRGRRALRLVTAVAAITVISIGILWSFYSFRYRARPAPVEIIPSLSEYAAPIAHTPINKPFALLQRGHLLPESYLYGLLDVLYVSRGRPTFLLGNWYITGKWYYFPVAFFIKSTLAFMALLLLAVAGFAFGANRAAPESTASTSTVRRLVFLAVPPLLYFLVSISSKMNLGVRHVMPMFPFLIALAAAGAWRLWQRSRAWAVVVGVLVAFHIFSSLRSFPDYLPYSNELFGGKQKTYQLLNASNADWGQGLKQTARYLEEHNISGDCWLAYFGTGTPAAYGIHCKPLPGFFNLGAVQLFPGAGCAARDPDLEGTLIIGGNVPTGSINGPLDLNAWSQFLHEAPAANIGGSMLVFRGRYHLPRIAAFCHASDAMRLLQAKQPEQATEEARTAVAMAPRDVGNHYALGEALLATKQNDGAKAEFQTALQLAQSTEPEFHAPWIAAIKRRLGSVTAAR